MYRATDRKESEELIVRRIARRLDRYLTEMERSLANRQPQSEDKTQIVSTLSKEKLSKQPNAAISSPSSGEVQKLDLQYSPQESLTEEKIIPILIEDGKTPAPKVPPPAPPPFGASCPSPPFKADPFSPAT